MSHSFHGNSRAVYERIRARLAELFPSHRFTVGSEGHGILRFTWDTGAAFYSTLFDRDEFVELLEKKWDSPFELGAKGKLDIGGKEA